MIYFFFKETVGVSLEDIDLLFGERALGTLPDDLDHKGDLDLHPGVAGTELHQIEGTAQRDNDSKV